MVNDILATNFPKTSAVRFRARLNCAWSETWARSAAFGASILRGLTASLPEYRARCARFRLGVDPVRLGSHRFASSTCRAQFYASPYRCGARPRLVPASCGPCSCGLERERPAHGTNHQARSFGRRLCLCRDQPSHGLLRFSGRQSESISVHKGPHRRGRDGSRSATIDDHGHAEPRTKGDQGPRLNPVLWQ